jgi:hypothetical protein
MHSYTCPNCNEALVLDKAVPPGKKVKCGNCDFVFVPNMQTFAVAKEPPAKPARAEKAAKAAPVSPPAPAKKTDDEDDDGAAITAYGVVKETEAEKNAADKNKVKFTNIQEKHKRSARGPASAALVLPTNLLIFAGVLTSLAGIVVILIYIWNLIFTDASPSDDEINDALPFVGLGLLMFFWGGLVCFGAFKMQNLESYSWALAGAVLGSIPLLVGLFALITLRDPKVIAGFQESTGGPTEDEEDNDDEDEEDEEDDD